MMVKFLMYTGIVKLILYCYQTGFIPQSTDENKPPKVVITKPVENARLQWNSIVPYSIYVNDPEDGNSEYDEISSREVLLMVNYLPDPTDADKYLNQGIDKIPEPLIQMGKSTCFNCHASKAKMFGPSFELIATRYGDNPSEIEALMENVTSGSTGTWGDLKMPPHPDLDNEQLRKIISWILENGANPNKTFYVGTEGIFRTIEKPAGKAGVYVLTASYSDHGINDMPTTSRQGNHTVVLKPF